MTPTTGSSSASSQSWGLGTVGKWLLGILIGMAVIAFALIFVFAGCNSSDAKADAGTKEQIAERKRQWQQSGERRAAPEARRATHEWVAPVETKPKYPREQLTPELRQSQPELWPNVPVAEFLMEPGDSVILTLGPDGLTNEAVYVSPAVNWEMWHYRANGEQSLSPTEKKSAPTRGRGHFSRFRHDDAVHGERPLRLEIIVVSLKPQYR